MYETMIISIVLILGFSVLMAFMRVKKRDKCLVDFEGYNVTLLAKDKPMITGRLKIFSTGLEFEYPHKLKTPEGGQKSSYILYRSEFDDIQVLVRDIKKLTKYNVLKRNHILKVVRKPSIFRRGFRKFLNTIRTVRDILMEILNLFISQAQKVAGGNLLKMSSKTQKELGGQGDNSYEPMFEQYLGRRIIIQILDCNEKVCEYSGILKEYTANFVELMDVSYRLSSRFAYSSSDLVVSRKYAIIRGLAE